MPGAISCPEPRVAPYLRDDERRRYYRITEGGLAAVRGEAERMASSVRAARAKALIPGEEAP